MKTIFIILTIFLIAIGLFGVCAGFLAAMGKVYDAGYKRGQIEAWRGEFKYDLKKVEVYIVEELE